MRFLLVDHGIFGLIVIIVHVVFKTLHRRITLLADLCTKTGLAILTKSCTLKMSNGGVVPTELSGRMDGRTGKAR